jgi:SpoVK/Ycf46/Vps4 family AAA+-type ATPase
MKDILAQEEQVTFLPKVIGRDVLANYWLRQVTYRLRREICWLWEQRGQWKDRTGGELPPAVDTLTDVLDLSRYAEEKQRFFRTHEVARYLSTLVAEDPPSPPREVTRGTFSWCVEELLLRPVDCFVLALGLTAVFDSTAGTVFAACLNDPNQQVPTLSLAQRLWDQPVELLALADPAHPLYARGLLHGEDERDSGRASPCWARPLGVSPLVARQLLGLEQDLPDILTLVQSRPDSLHTDVSGEEVVISRLIDERMQRRRIVPLEGPPGAPLDRIAARISEKAGARLAVLNPGSLTASSSDAAFTVLWLRGLNLFMDLDWEGGPIESTGQQAPLPKLRVPPAGLPITVFLAVRDPEQRKRVFGHDTLPSVRVSPQSYDERLAVWRESLRGARLEAGCESDLAECTRSFRYEQETIRAIARGLRSLRRPISRSDIISACRAETRIDFSGLAHEVVPRFRNEKLMLPPRQEEQIEEIIRAMKSLPTVHYEWGMGTVWNESGLSILFAGPPGTGKTMAAEVICEKVGLPLYRVDLSQVVNKYIGETEKNLRRVFDAAETTDVCILFDEADALFGKRTAVKDAHDRFANIEISYLLERMDRFKGFTILTTNRKGDLDEAFLRRLRFVVDFPLPGPNERLRIWKQVIPESIDTSDVDFEFLARSFALTGGHIRSIVFSVCLQSAYRSGGSEKRLDMKSVLVGVKREYEKLERSLTMEQFGSYAQGLEHLFTT